jgi:DNA replicative helicase MCM subunit Mcm2 (Cdc46/Mcm family)
MSACATAVDAAKCNTFLRRCFQVEWDHMNSWDPRLAEEIQKSFYVLHEFLLTALRSFIESVVPDHVVNDMGQDKTFQVAFRGVSPQVQLRDLRTCEIGKLISIVGTVTRTGDVRPELVNGTFLCLECRAEIRNIQQQFKYATRSSSNRSFLTSGQVHAAHILHQPALHQQEPLRSHP